MFTAKLIGICALSLFMMSCRNTASDSSANLSSTNGPVTLQAASANGINIPGRIEAEDFDDYKDSDSGNNGGQYRETDVDIKLSTDTDTYSVGWMANGEFLSYNIEVAEPGEYRVDLRVASAHSDAVVHVEVDGSDVTGPLNVPNTGNWDTTYETLSHDGIALKSGSQTLKVVVDRQYLDLDFIELVLTRGEDSTSSVPRNSFQATYFKDNQLGSAITSRSEAKIDHDWGNGSPADSVPADNFSARWLGDFEFNQGNYKFEVVADDGVRLYVDDQLVIDQWKAQAPTKYEATLPLTAGIHRIRMEYFELYGGAVARLNWTALSTEGPASPTRIALPGQFEAEDYNSGGQGVGYYDNSSGNTGGAFRKDDVDLKVCSEGGYNLGWTQAGEWLKYDVEIASDGNYDFEFRVSRGTTGLGRFHLEVDDKDVTGPVAVPSTGDWNRFTSVRRTQVPLQKGSHTLKFYIEVGDFDLNWVKVTPSSAGETPVTDVPPGSVPISPGESIQAAVDRHPDGTNFLLRSGVHRMQSVRPKNGNGFYGESGTVLSGARRIYPVRQGSYYVATGLTQQGRVNGVCSSGHPRCGHPEDLFVNDQPLDHVAQLSQVGPGKWFFDYDRDTIYMADDPNGKVVEIGEASFAFISQANNVTISGLVIEKYATVPQDGTIWAGQGWTISNNLIRLNHGTAVVANTNGRILNNRIIRNAQHGLGAVGDNILIEGNEIAYNNDRHWFDYLWSAGGSKFVDTNDLVVRDNCAHHNGGPGLWTDINNRRTLYERNIAFENFDSGIYHEISYDAVIRNNVSAYNGNYFHNWILGGQISVSTSRNVEVYNNLVIAKQGGLGITLGEREGGTTYRSLQNHVYNNDITFLDSDQRSVSGGGTLIKAHEAEFFSQNSFNNNRYHSPNPGAIHFSWNSRFLNFSEFRSLGQESNGTIDSNVQPRSISCDMPLPF